MRWMPRSNLFERVLRCPRCSSARTLKLRLGVAHNTRQSRLPQIESYPMCLFLNSSSSFRSASLR